MPFIRFLAESRTADGPKEQVRFINVDQISEAAYDRGTGKFTAFIGDRPGGKGWDLSLNGEEAKEALAIFQTLYRDILERSEDGAK